MSNNLNKGSNSIFVIVISLFIVIFIIVSYFMLSGNLFDESEIEYPINKNMSRNYNKSNKISNSSNFNKSNNINNDDREVFNIRDNIFTYDEAKAVCKAYDSKLATLEQMIQAYKNGANWCSYGWSDGQLALYPTQKDFWKKLQEYPYRRNECGEVGLNGGYFENVNYKFGANCYGKKPEARGHEMEKSMLGEQNLSEIDLMAEKYKVQKNDINLSPFSHVKWSE